MYNVIMPKLKGMKPLEPRIRERHNGMKRPEIHKT